MNKQDVVKILQEVLKGDGFKFTLKEIDALLKCFSETYATVGEQLDVGESVCVGDVKVEKKLVAARKGKTTFDDKEVEWETPEKIRVMLRAKQSFINKHEKEV